MGCDIHMWLEYRKSTDVAWQILQDAPCTRCRPPDGKASTECWRCQGSGIDHLNWVDEDGNKVADQYGSANVRVVFYFDN